MLCFAIPTDAINKQAYAIAAYIVVITQDVKYPNLSTLIPKRTVPSAYPIAKNTWTIPNIVPNSLSPKRAPVK